MKKYIIPIVVLLFIITLVSTILFFNSNKKITSETEIEIIKEDSNLDILVNLGNFSKENYSEKKLLDVSMKYAEKLGLIKETTNQNIYLENVDKTKLHDLIKEFTGIYIESPIEIDDFYYLYDNRNSYYYFLGASPALYNVSNIKKVERNNNIYTINCSIEKTEDGETITSDDVLVILKYVPENSLIKYQVEEIIIKIKKFNMSNFI